MRHYVCVGDCVEVTSSPGVCTTEGCTHEGKALIACSCNDEMHDEAFEKASKQPESQVIASNDDEEPSDEDLMDIEEEGESDNDY